MTSLRSVGISATNEKMLGDTSFGTSEVGVAKQTLLVEDKNERWLVLPLLEADDIYSLGASISNKLNLFSMVLDNKFSSS